MALKSNMGPREGVAPREGNQAATEAALMALSTTPVEGRHYVRLRKRQIEPDAHQPRRHKGFKAVRDKRDSLEQEGQQTPVRVLATGKSNRQGEPLYRLIDGELRWLGVVESDAYLDTIIESPMTEEEVVTAQVTSNTGEDFSPAELCSIAWRFHNQFGQTHKQIATGVLRKYAAGKEEWVGQRVRVWDKLEPNVYGEPQSKEGQLIDEMLTQHADTFTHAQAIVGAPVAKWARAVEMVTKEGATVAAINFFLNPAKAKVPAKSSAPSAANGSAITTHRGGGGVPNPSLAPSSSPSTPMPSPAPTQEEIEAEFEGAFDDAPTYGALQIQTLLQGAQSALDRAIEKLPEAKARRDYTPLARAAIEKQARRLRETQVELLEALNAK